MSRLTRLLLLFTICLSAFQPVSVTAQTKVPNGEAARIVAGLTPEERVGQLFLVTFSGANTGAESSIRQLITQHHVGGVALLAANDNFGGTQTLITETISLTSALQSIAAGETSGQDGLQTLEPPSKNFIPLFIAASFDDETPSGNSLMPGLSGLTALPSPMTLGATWSTSHSQAAGQVVGQELSALGINLLVGPTLDVVETPQPDSPADLGARAFGGDSYWVGKLGRAFIQGIHLGSANRVAVVSRHFPGYGAGDRAIGDQIPTINKLLAELVAVDLVPFFTVTKGDTLSNTDALLVSHIRYHGFQSARETTKPISFDQQALTTLLGLPEIAPWRANGGVTISDALGVRGVRRFYDPSGRTFQPFKVALDAFLAGNDVLYLSQFGLNPQDDQTETVKSVIGQFVQKYKQDPAFALRVDESATRIVGLKLRMYGDFSIGAVLPPISPEPFPDASAAMFAAVRDAATLISPSPSELTDRLPSPPSINQQIAFFTDARIARQCSSCAQRSIFPVDGLEQAVLKLYGPQGSGQVVDSNLTSFSFADLINFLDGTPLPPTPTPDPSIVVTPAPPQPNIEDTINNAEWLVFALLDVKDSLPASKALSRFLAQRPDLIRGKRVIVFAFDAPYYLDSTEIAQLTAYYGLYSKTPVTLQVAASILFQEIVPTGASPVSIPSVRYSLVEVTQPDPDQVIQLFADVPQPENATPAPSSDITPTPPAFALNSIVALRTGVIIDHNGNPVPDGTVANFFVNYLTEGITASPIKANTVDGIARTALLLDRSGLVEVSVVSDPSLVSYKLRFDVGPEIRTPVVIIPPPEPSDTPTPSSTPTVTPPPTITPTPTPDDGGGRPEIAGGDLLMALVALAVLGGAGWRLTNSRGDAVSAGVKVFLVVSVGVFASYNYYALGLPGAMALKALGGFASPLITWSGGALSLFVGWVWFGRKQ